MSNTVTFTGITMHLEGTLPGVGDKAPDFSLADGELKARSLGDYSGRVLVLVCVPSLDTPVCDMEVRRFNKEAAGLSDKVPPASRPWKRFPITATVRSGAPSACIFPSLGCSPAASSL